MWVTLFGLGGLVVAALCCGIGGYFAVKNAKNWAVDLARNFAVEAIKESDLTEEDQQQVIEQVDRVVAAYKAGEIDEEKLKKILTEVQTSPLLPLAVVYGMEKQYLDKSGLTDEEKADARKQLQRMIRGVMEKKIAESQVDALMVPLQETGPDGRDACGAFAADTGVPVAPVVTMTEVLSHLEATGRLPAADRARCVEYLDRFGTPPAKAWAAARR